MCLYLTTSHFTSTVCAIQVTLSGVLFFYFLHKYRCTKSHLIHLFLSRTAQLEQLNEQKKKRKKKPVVVHFPNWDMTLFCSYARHAKTAEFFQSEYTRKPVKVLSVLVLEYNPLYSDRAIWTHTWSPGTRWSREPPDRDAGLGQLP